MAPHMYRAPADLLQRPIKTQTQTLAHHMRLTPSLTWLNSPGFDVMRFNIASLSTIRV